MLLSIEESCISLH